MKKERYFVYKKGDNKEIIYIDYNKLSGFNFAPQNQKKYDGVIIFTDGYAPEVKLNFKLQTRVGWILYNSDGFQHWMKKIGLCSVMSE